MLLIVAGGQFVRFVVNVICEDFIWLGYKCIPQRLCAGLQ
jgi:hypothetical protein